MCESKRSMLTVLTEVPRYAASNRPGKLALVRGRAHTDQFCGNIKAAVSWAGQVTFIDASVTRRAYPTRGTTFPVKKELRLLTDSNAEIT